jgi:hypothetical protein
VVAAADADSSSSHEDILPSLFCRELTTRALGTKRLVRMRHRPGDREHRRGRRAAARRVGFAAGDGEEEVTRGAAGVWTGFGGDGSAGPGGVRGSIPGPKYKLRARKVGVRSKRRARERNREYFFFAECFSFLD